MGAFDCNVCISFLYGMFKENRSIALSRAVDLFLCNKTEIDMRRVAARTVQPDKENKTHGSVRMIRQEREEKICYMK